MSLATIIVLVLAIMFFGGILYLDYLGRKESKQESRPGEPDRLVPREQPVEPSERAANPSLSGPVTFQPRSSRKRKKHARHQRHAHGHAAS